MLGSIMWAGIIMRCWAEMHLPPTHTPYRFKDTNGIPVTQEKFYWLLSNVSPIDTCFCFFNHSCDGCFLLWLRNEKIFLWIFSDWWPKKNKWQFFKWGIGRQMVWIVQGKKLNMVAPSSGMIILSWHREGGLGATGRNFCSN